MRVHMGYTCKNCISRCVDRLKMTKEERQAFDNLTLAGFEPSVVQA